MLYSRLDALLNNPFVLSVRMAMAMRRKKSATMLPEQRPELFEVGFWEVQFPQVLTREELKRALSVRRRHGFKPGLNFKQKHQPMGLPLVTVFADKSRQVQVSRLQSQPEFLLSFTAGASVGRLAAFRVQFATAGTPATAIRLPSPFHQEYFIAFVETVKQRGNAVRQGH